MMLDPRRPAFNLGWPPWEFTWNLTVSHLWDWLSFQKVCVRWVPRKYKVQRVSATQGYLDRFRDKDGFVNRRRDLGVSLRPREQETMEALHPTIHEKCKVVKSTTKIVTSGNRKEFYSSIFCTRENQLTQKSTVKLLRNFVEQFKTREQLCKLQVCVYRSKTTVGLVSLVPPLNFLNSLDSMF